MRTYRFDKVDITSGYLFGKQELNRLTTINAVYDRFCETGRIGAFDFDYAPSDDKKPPHVYWDSDVAKWRARLIFLKSIARPSLKKRLMLWLKKSRRISAMTVILIFILLWLHPKTDLNTAKSTNFTARGT